MRGIPQRPAGSIDKSYLIPRISRWREYANERVIDAYAVPTDDLNVKVLYVVTIGWRQSEAPENLE